MRYYKVFGHQISQPFVECTPYNVENYPLGESGKFQSIDDAEYAIQAATHFYYPRYPKDNLFNRVELLQLGVQFVIIQFYSVDDKN